VDKAKSWAISILMAYLIISSVAYIMNKPEYGRIEQLQTEIKQLKTQVDTLNAKVTENDKIVNRWIEVEVR
jgi:outer membrane murein-binding lipoprotein Lpp